MSEKLVKAIQGLLALVENLRLDTEQYERFKQLDLTVYIEARKSQLVDELPVSTESCIGKVNLPGNWIFPLQGGESFFTPIVTQEWRTSMDVLLALAQSQIENNPAPVADQGEVVGLIQGPKVDLVRKTIDFNGKTHDVSSDLALRWVRVLAENEGQWITASDLRDHDQELDGARPDRFKRHLPDQIKNLIDSFPKKGSRLRLP